MIGDGCMLFHNVTIGGNGKTGDVIGAPVIGKNVFIGAGAVILGPITIGDGAKIGANSVVLHDVPEGATAVGMPAKVVKMHD